MYFDRNISYSFDLNVAFFIQNYEIPDKIFLSVTYKLLLFLKKCRAKFNRLQFPLNMTNDDIKKILRTDSQQMWMCPSTCLKVAAKCLTRQITSIVQLALFWGRRGGGVTHIIIDMPRRMIGMISLSWVFVL